MRSQNKNVVFKGKLLTLSTKTVLLPNGFRAHLEVIEHPGAVLIVPFLSKDKVILLRQFRPVLNTYLYELPAGTLKNKEALLACAKRELIEETGYAAKSFKKLGAIYPVPGYSTEKITIYAAEVVKAKYRRVEEDEVIQSCFVTKAKIKRLLRKGKIVDAKTICALGLCGWLP